MSGYTVAQKAKAVVAFIGSTLTLVLGGLAQAGVVSWQVGSVNVLYVLAVAAAVATYVGTYAVPNAPVEDAPVPTDPEVDGTH